MSLTDSQKLDILWKKLAFGYATTDSVNKSPENEYIVSPISISGDNLYIQANEIPEIPPGSSTDIIDRRVGAGIVECIADPTTSRKRTWIAVADSNAGITNANRLTDWISPSYGVHYQVRVYAGDPTDGGEIISQFRKNHEWYFDYVAGVLHFPNNVNFGNETIYLEGYRYIGRKGIGSFSQGYTLILTYAGATLDDVSVPAGWSVEIDDATACTFTVTHALGLRPNWVSFFGQGPTVGTQYRLRLPNTFTEILYDTSAPNSFQVTNATPYATGAQNGTTAFCQVLF